MRETDMIYESILFKNEWENLENASLDWNYFNRHNSDRDYFYELKEDNIKNDLDINFEIFNTNKKQEEEIEMDIPNHQPEEWNKVEEKYIDDILVDDLLPTKDKSSKTYDGILEKISLENSDNNLFIHTDFNNWLKGDLNSDNASEVCNNSEWEPMIASSENLSEKQTSNNINSNNDVSSIKVIPESTFVCKDAKESESVTYIGSSKASRKAKTTEFAYLLERKAFRMMRKYYKEKFEFNIDLADYKKRLPTMRKHEIDELVLKFMDEEFNFLSGLLTKNDYERTKDALKTIILWDRYKKKEWISEGLNFMPLRNVLHRYNTRNLIELLSDASFSFLFTHFFLMDGKKAAGEQSDVDSAKLIHRMRHLMTESSNYLPKEINTLFEEIYNSVYK